MSLLKIENLRIESRPRRGVAARMLLDGLSVNVAEGEFVSIVGESGSGKTLAARAILDLLPPGIRRAGGHILFDGRDLTSLPRHAMRAVRGARIGMVFQEPMVSLNPALTIGMQLEEGLRLHSQYSPREIRGRIIEMLARVRISDPQQRLAAFPHEFSGGMRQRIMLASVMLLKPRLLIADEPTTALDTLSQKDVMDVMVELAREEKVSVLFITHDLGLVAQYANRVVVLEKGHLVEQGETTRVLGHPSHPYTAKLIASLPRPGRGRALPTLGPELLRVEQACVSYDGKAGMWFSGKPKQVVMDADLTLRQGETVALVGASGSGKSTLGRAVLGLKRLDRGTIKFGGRDIATMPARERRDFRCATQLVFQDPFSSLDPRMRIGDIIAAPLRHVPGLSATQRHTRVQAVLAEVSLEHFAERYAHEMSGGQRQRVAIARAIVSRPRLIVADEPVSALDVTIQRQLLTLLQNLQNQYRFAMLFITHDLAVAEEMSDRVAVMSAAQIVETGAVGAVFASPQHPYTRALLSATPSMAAIALAQSP